MNDESKKIQQAVALSFDGKHAPKVTATGKYKVSVQSATDGSQNPVAIVVRDTQDITATTDTKVPVIARGPLIVSKAGLVLDATFKDAAKKAAAYASLQTVGILANDAV